MISSAQELESFYNISKALGAPAISSDGTMVIDGFESMYVTIKQFPWPVIAPMGEIETSEIMGSMNYEPQQLKTAFSGPITFKETINGTVQKLLNDIAAQGGKFSATMHEGTPDNAIRSLPIVNAFIVMDVVDRDSENRGQALLLTGQIFFRYVGQTA